LVSPRLAERQPPHPKRASAQTPRNRAPHGDPPAPPHASRGMSAATPRRLAQRLGWTKASDGKGGDWEACGGAAKFNLEKLVGRGSYGQVCAATQIRDGKQVAVKRVVGAFDSRRDALCIIREVRILAALPRHDNIVNLLDVRTPLEDPSDDADVFLIFEKAATDLEKVVASNQYFTGDHIRWLSLDLLRGLRWLHSAGVVHRDLKPANCLLEVKPVSLKICDFGPWLSVLDLVAAMASS
jgi:serine/threonine protein kinase